MIRVEAKQLFIENSQKLPLEQKPLPVLVDKIYDDFEQDLTIAVSLSGKSCKTCRWLRDEACTNSESTKCADFPDLEMMCNNYYGREHERD